MIEEIYIAPNRHAPQERKSEVEVHSGMGILGDRNYGVVKYPGQNVTFIEKEVINSFNNDHKQSNDISATRRNVITQGVNLNNLVGKTFKFGSVLFLGIELCEPCKLLGDDLSDEFISSAGVVKAFVNRGGLRANVLTSGVLSVGMRMELINA